MKLLKIEESRGFFISTDNEYQPLDKLTKEDLLRLVDLALSDQDINFDEMDDENLQHQAHRIIYRSVRDKLIELVDRRSEFTDESERLFLEEYDRYKADLVEPATESPE